MDDEIYQLVEAWAGGIQTEKFDKTLAALMLAAEIKDPLKYQDAFMSGLYNDN